MLDTVDIVKAVRSCLAQLPQSDEWDKVRQEALEGMLYERYGYEPPHEFVVGLVLGLMATDSRFQNWRYALAGGI